MSETKKKHDSLVLSRSDLWMLQRCHVIPRVDCYFCFEPVLRKDTWIRTASVIATVIFFESGILNVTWSQLCSKSLLSSYEAHWQQHFEWYTALVYFTGMINMCAKYFIKTSVNVTEMRIDEGAWKKIVTQSVHLKEHCSKIETTFHLFYALLFLTNLVLNFHIA